MALSRAGAHASCDDKFAGDAVAGVVAVPRDRFEVLGVCVDACHLAVEFEEPVEALRRLSAAGVRVGKIQISTGLEAVLEPGDHASEAALLAFADDVYLHQVVQSCEGQLTRFTDLPEALEAVDPRSRLWRVHFHAPIFLERLGRFRNTRRELGALLAAVKDGKTTQHLEVETYSWAMLPEAHRGKSMLDDIGRELRWASAQLTAPSESPAGHRELAAVTGRRLAS